MKECREIKERLIDFIENALSESQRDLFQRHLDECENCRQLYQEFKAVYGSLDSAETITPSPAFFPRLMEKVEKYEAEKVSLVEIWEYFTGRARPVIASFAVAGAMIAGYFLGSGAITQSSAVAQTESVSLSDYYGMNYLDLSSELTVPQIYNEILEEGGGNE